MWGKQLKGGPPALWAGLLSSKVSAACHILRDVEGRVWSMRQREVLPEAVGGLLGKMRGGRGKMR